MRFDLSVIILSYNTKNLTQKCLTSLVDNIAKNKTLKAQIVVVDNGSTDGSVEILKQIKNRITKNQSISLNFKPIFNKKNVGYPKGNNQGLTQALGKYILFLNSDVIIKRVNFSQLIDYFEKDRKIGVLTVKVVLKNGQVDPASHRGFPTIWNSFCYFVGLEKFFGKVPFLARIFGGYHLVDRHLTSIHEIDSPSGAFYFTKKNILNEVGGFDEDYFMYGEDLDLSFRIKKLGYKVIYYPYFEVIHLKHASGLEKKGKIKTATKEYFFEAMKIFYKKHYAINHLSITNRFIYFWINILKKIWI